MGRYLVERTFPEGFALAGGGEGAQVCGQVIDNNTALGVTWVHSYVAADHRKTFCLYDAPSPEAIRQAAERNGLPVDQIILIEELSPYFYWPA
jgi:hypothetical protein